MCVLVSSRSYQEHIVRFLAVCVQLTSRRGSWHDKYLNIDQANHILDRFKGKEVKAIQLHVSIPRNAFKPLIYRTYTCSYINSIKIA